MTAAQIYAQGERRMWRFWTPLVVLMVAAVVVANYQSNGLAVLLLIITGIVAFFAVVDWVNVEIKAHRILRAEAELYLAGH